jgi:hypothetical protein
MQCSAWLLIDPSNWIVLEEILYPQVHRQRAAARRQGFIDVPFFPLGKESCI